MPSFEHGPSPRFSMAHLIIRPVGLVRGYQAGVHGLGFARDGTWLATTDTYAIHLLQRASNRRYDRERILAVPAVALALAPGQPWLAAACFEGGVQVWSLEGHLLYDVLPPSEHATSVHWFPQEPMLAIGKADGSISLWNAVTQTLSPPFTAPFVRHTDLPPKVAHLVITPDGGHVVYSCADQVTVLAREKVQKGMPPLGPFVRSDGVTFRHTTVDPNEPILALALSPDGQVLAVSGYTETCIWLVDRRSFAVLGKLPLPEEQVYPVACDFSPDGCFLAVATYAGWVWMWDMRSRQAVGSFPAHTEGWSPDSQLAAMGSLRWAPDGRYLVTGGTLSETFPDPQTGCFTGPVDYTVRVWQVQTTGV